jgi:hypothetical protein
MEEMHRVIKIKRHGKEGWNYIGLWKGDGGNV